MNKMTPNIKTLKKPGMTIQNKDFFLIKFYICQKIRVKVPRNILLQYTF